MTVYIVVDWLSGIFDSAYSTPELAWERATKHDRVIEYVLDSG